MAVSTEQIATLLQQKLSDGHSAFLHVVSSSMAPLLQRGDEIEVVTIEAKHLRVRDLILVRAPGALFSHRFWGIAAGQLITRGDRPLSFDPPWNSDQLLGKIVGWRRQERYFDLTGPAGQQLNEKLGDLAQKELGFFAKLYRRPELATLPDGANASLNFTQVRRFKLLTFLIRRLFLARAVLLTHLYLPRLRR